jgi:pilus assembly protein Flp/PilA
MLPTFMKNIVDDTSGATAIEYGLIVSLIVLVIVGSMNGVADATIGMWSEVEASSNNAVGN